MWHRRVLAALARPFSSSLSARYLTAELQRHRTTFDLASGFLSGPGAEMLGQVARDHQFVLLGEEHGTAETARFARALWRHLAQAGFAHLGIETGPATAGILERTAAAGPQQLVDLVGRYFFSIPFFYWQEEMELLTMGPDSIPPRLWGLDQEFILSPGLHFDRLRDHARHPAQRALADEFSHRAHQAHTQMVENHDPEALFLLQIAPQDWERLLVGFEGDEDALFVLHQLRRSADIYSRFHEQSYYESNVQRSRLMREYFVAAYRAAESRDGRMPRAMLKLGGTHVMRGLSLYGIFDLGGFVSEFAAMRGTASFHLLVLPAQGFVNGWLPFLPDESLERQPYDPVRELPFAAAPILRAADSRTWTLFDLRPLHALLRQERFAALEPRLKSVLYGFDAIVVIPFVTPATIIPSSMPACRPLASEEPSLDT